MEVVWTQEAILSYQETIDYWDNRTKSYSYSDKIINEIEKNEKEIAENPYFLSVYSEKLGLFRKFFFNGKFVVFYKVFEKEQRIEIRYFRSTRQKALV